MPDTITSVAGDTVDIICRRHYGDESGYVEPVLDTNHGLAEFVFIPVGTKVFLPDVNVETVSNIITLWD